MAEIRRKMSTAEATFLRWKKRYASLGELGCRCPIPPGGAGPDAGGRHA